MPYLEYYKYKTVGIIFYYEYRSSKHYLLVVILIRYNKN